MRARLLIVSCLAFTTLLCPPPAAFAQDALGIAIAEENAAQAAYITAINAAAAASEAYDKAVKLRQPETILVGLRNALNAANATCAQALARWEAAKKARATVALGQSPTPAQPQPTVINNYTTVQAPKDPKWGVGVNPDGSTSVRTRIGGGSSSFVLDLPIFGPSRSSVNQTQVTETYITPAPQPQVTYQQPTVYTGADPYAPQPYTSPPYTPRPQYPGYVPPRSSEPQALTISQPLPTSSPRAEEGTAASPLLPPVSQARSLIQLGRTDEAIQVLKRQIASRDTDALAMRWLALAQMIRGESASAGVLMQTAYVVDPTLVNSPMNVGYFPDGETGSFATMMSAVTYANNKRTPTAYFTAAVLAQAANRPDMGRRMLDRGRGAGIDPALADSLDAAMAAATPTR